MITPLVLRFTAWHLYWSSHRLVALKEQGWGKKGDGKEAVQSERFGCYSLILRGVGFSQDSFSSFQTTDGGRRTDFSNNLSKCESRNTASRDLKAASPSALFHEEKAWFPDIPTKVPAEESPPKARQKAVL